MSTAARELEELRKIREAERLRKEEEQKIADEKAAKLAKKNEFLNRANAFQQKKGPSDEEIKAQVSKASQKRNFGKQLNNALKGEPGKNAFALELGMRNKLGNESHNGVKSGHSPWELVEQAGEQPYYWNKITNETQYERPADMDSGAVAPPPPPPPPMRLPGMMQPPPPAAVPPPAFVPPPPAPTPPAPSSSYVAPPAPVRSDWTYVFENEPTPYYWNTVTNETTFDRPAEYRDQVYVSATATEDAGEHVAAQGEEAEGGVGGMNMSIMWQEVEVEGTGETHYVNMGTGETRLDQPEGTVVVVVANPATGEEENWQVCAYEEGETGGEFGAIYYHNMATGESREDRPEGGAVIIVENVE